MTITLSTLGWDERLRTAYRRHDRPDQRPARVTCAGAGVCCLLAADGAWRASVGGALLAAAAHDRTHLPQVGDWVVLRTWPDTRVTVEAVLPRTTVLSGGAPVGSARPADRAGHPQVTAGPPLVTNVDAVVVVVPAKPEPDRRCLDGLLGLALTSGAEPVLALTKVDQLARGRTAELLARLEPALGGIRVLAVSAKRGDGMDELRALAAPGRTVALVGPAGAGRSTIVAALAGATVLPQRPEQRPTPTSLLVALPGGGTVVDMVPVAAQVRRPSAGRGRGWPTQEEPEGRQGRRWASSS